jgi:hypothetical protein
MTNQDHSEVRGVESLQIKVVEHVGAAAVRAGKEVAE